MLAYILPTLIGAGDQQRQQEELTCLFSTLAIATHEEDSCCRPCRSNRTNVSVCTANRIA